MSAQILDGKLLAQKIKDQLKKEVIDLKKKSGKTPHLINVLIGEDVGSIAYAQSQKKLAEEIGFTYALEKFSSDLSQEKLSSFIKKLNADSDVHGLMLFQPTPKHIDYHTVANLVDVRKDWEGVNPVNLGKLLLAETSIIPCTPASAMELIKSSGISIRGKEAVVVGRSPIVGKPMSLLLLNESATVTVCHGGTSEAGTLKEHVERADILVVAMGKPQFIKGDWIKEGAIVIDVGINRLSGKIVGDVEFEKAKEKAAFITPVPGGVGPLTTVLLMKNGLESFKLQTNNKDK